MNKIIGLSVLLVLGPLSSAQSQDDAGRQFVGMWRLVSRPQRLADGTTRQSPQSVAYFIYSDTGHMCFLGMNPNRPRWKSPASPTPEEQLSAARGFAAYCAVIELHAKEGFIVQRREIDQNPNGIGSEHKRWFAFQGPDRLSLRIDSAELNAPVVEDTLNWERVVK
jgi:hypothetical protein